MDQKTLTPEELYKYLANLDENKIMDQKTLTPEELYKYLANSEENEIKFFKFKHEISDKDTIVMLDEKIKVILRKLNNISNELKDINEININNIEIFYVNLHEINNLKLKEYNLKDINFDEIFKQKKKILENIETVIEEINNLQPSDSKKKHIQYLDYIKKIIKVVMLKDIKLIKIFQTVFNNNNITEDLQNVVKLYDSHKKNKKKINKILNQTKARIEYNIKSFEKNINKNNKGGSNIIMLTEQIKSKEYSEELENIKKKFDEGFKIYQEEFKKVCIAIQTYVKTSIKIFKSILDDKSIFQIE